MRVFVEGGSVDARLEAQLASIGAEDGETRLLDSKLASEGLAGSK